MEQYIKKSALVAEIERLVNNQDSALDYEAALEDVLNIIDSLQEEPVSEDLNTESMIESYKQRLISQANGMKNSPLISMCLASYKHGINDALDTLNLSNVERTVKNWKEEQVSGDFEMALAEMIDKAQKCVVEPWVVAAQWKDELVKLAKGEKLVSGDLEDAASSFARKDSKEISNPANFFYTVADKARIFKAGAEWQKEKDFQYIKKERERVGSCCDEDIAIEAQRRHPYYYTSDIEAYANIGFKEGATWQKEQDQSTIELAEDHAMLAGMEKMKEEMTAKAVEVTVHIDAGGYPYIPQIELYDYNKDIPLAKEGDKYKVVLIKEV